MNALDLYNWLLGVMTTVGILMVLNLGLWISTRFWKLTENWQLVYDGMKICQIVFAAVLMILTLAIGLDRSSIY